MSMEIAEAYQALKAATEKAAKAKEHAIKSGDVNMLTAATAELKLITQEFKKVVEANTVEIPRKGRLIRPEYDALCQLAKDNNKDALEILGGIEKIEGGRVTGLKLHRSQLTNISAIAKLTGLKELGLADNQIQDLTPLAGLTNLNWLWLENNQIQDLAPLAGLTNLTRLWLNDNQIQDLSPLAKMSKLTTLTLNDNQIQPTPSNTSIIATLKARGCKISGAPA